MAASANASGATVDGVAIEVPPPPPGVNGQSNGATPPKNGKKGGSTTPAAPSVVVRPEDELPALTVEKFAAAGSENTGHSYALEQRKFLTWMKNHSLTFENMPPGTADRFLIESIKNPVSRNKGVVALNTMFEIAKAQGIRFLPQEMTRMSRKKAAPPPAPAVAPQQGAQMTQPSQIAAPMVYTQPTSAPPVQQPAPQQQQATQQHTQQGAHVAPAFPSLGQRVKVSKIAGPSEAALGVPPGTPLQIGTYPKALIEADGSLDNFILQRIRPSHGPHAGQGPVIYRVENLDTSGRPFQGQSWDVPVLPDINGAQQQQGMQQMPQQMPMMQVAPAQPAQGNVTDKLFDRVLQLSEAANQRYEALLQSITQKSGGQIDPATMMLLQQMKPDPAVTLAQMKNEMKAEFEKMAQAATPPPVQQQQPMMPSFDPFAAAAAMQAAQPKADPAMDRLAAMIEKQSDMMNQLFMRQMTQPAAVQRDPIETFGQLMLLMDKNKQSDPIKDQLAALTLQKLNEKPTSSGFQEAIAHFQMIDQLRGGGEQSPDAFSRMLETIEVLAENADKVGSMVGKMRSGAISGAIRNATQPPQQRQLPPPQQPRQAAQPPQARKPAAPAAAAPKQPQRVAMPAAGINAFNTLVQVANTSPDDGEVGTALYSTLELLSGLGEPWAGISLRTLERYKAANAKPDVSAAVVQLFNLCSGGKALQHPEVVRAVDRIVNVLHASYSAIYKLLTDGQDKVLADAAPPLPVAAEPAPEMQAQAQAGEPEPEGDESEGEADEEEGDEEEGEDEPDTEEPETK